MKRWNAITMNMRIKAGLLFVALLPLAAAQSAELTGRFSMLGTTAQAESGDIGYVDNDNDTLSADQQSLRLMLEGLQDEAEWSLHIKTGRQQQSGYPLLTRHSSDLFRYRDLANDWINEVDGDSSTRIGYEIDRASYKHRFDKVTLSIGRQPVDWGSGRFWQPLNVFGTFAPTDLDTDFKPGIDAAMLDWYPSAFSSLTVVYVLAPEDNATINNSEALYYRRQVGENSEMALLAGRVTEHNVLGGSYETDWLGMGWRVEAAHYNLPDSADSMTFWIAGVDYQFNNGTLVAVEWYNNSRGADTQAELVSKQTDTLVEYALQQQSGQSVLGILLDKDMTPLLHGGYTLLISSLKDADWQSSSSFLHQLNLVYSVSNESDLLFSLLFANGSGLNQQNEPQSEFGHLPASMTVRLRFYF